MGWFMWGVTFGWAVCAIYYYSQTDNDKAANGAVILFLALMIISVVISVSVGLNNGTFGPPVPTPTPLLGR